MPTGLNSNHWFVRYKLYHLPFWIVYHYLWWTINIGNPLTAATNIMSSPYAIKYFFYVVFQALGVYFNLYFLIPRFLEKGKYVSYISLLLVTIIVTAALIVPGYYISGELSGKTMMELYGVKDNDRWFFFQINTLPSTVASMTLAMCVKLTKNWLKTKKREHLLQQEKLETELKFLRSQFNPHFLFNTINSIFVLIHKNPDKASASLAKFSELLRYQLYECNEQQIPLSQELEYLQNFIELEKLRQEKNLIVTVRINRNESGDLLIAPFILIPFVENAFKHVAKVNGETSRILVAIETDNNEMTMTVLNTVSIKSAKSNDIVEYGGIGLKNIKRRLELIYPGKNSLTLEHTTEEYEVTLQLSLAYQHQTKLKPVHV